MGADFGPDALPAEAGLEEHDRLHEGVLPGSGVGGEGAEPRPPAPGPACHVRSADRDPSGGTRARGRGGRRGGDERRGGERRDATRSSGSGGTRRSEQLSTASRTTLPTARRVDTSGHFLSATWGFAIDPTDDPFPAMVTPCYSFVPGNDGDPGGRNGRVRIDRLPSFDIDVLPDDPSPPTSGRSAPRATGSTPTSSSRSPRKRPVPRSRSAARARSARSASPGP